jgi:cobalt transporter subunit CbtA
MLLFRRIALSALLIGALGGLLLSAIQRWQVIPIIEAAERHEQALTPAATEPARDAAPAALPEGHSHEAGAWEPELGWERIGFTALSNVLIAIGFAFLMVAAMVTMLRRQVASGSQTAMKLDWRYGLLWGLAGYAVFFVAPSLGLPPEIPGAWAAPLASRQLWWVGAVICTAAGLAAAAFGKSAWRWAALGLLLVPHLVGVPHLAASPFGGYPPDVAAELAELARRFVWATAIANALFWLALGSASVWVVRRFLKEAVA